MAFIEALLCSRLLVFITWLSNISWSKQIGIALTLIAENVGLYIVSASLSKKSTIYMNTCTVLNSL